MANCQSLMGVEEGAETLGATAVIYYLTEINNFNETNTPIQKKMKNIGHFHRNCKHCGLGWFFLKSSPLTDLNFSHFPLL